MITLFTEQEIKNKVGEIAYNIKKKQHEQPPVFVCVLNGAFMFFTDLVKHMDTCNIDFIQTKSYEGITQTNIKIIKSLDTSICNRDVYIVDDIYDSGNTMNFIINHLKLSSPKSITPVTLFKRHNVKNEELIYGFNLENEYWLVGYGLDSLDGTKRNLPRVLGFLPED